MNLPITTWWRPRLLLLGAALLLVLVLRQGCGGRGEAVAVATFNIRNYPESPQQEQGAFALLRELAVPVVAVQEIRQPAQFEAAARQRLGSSWRFVWPARGPEQRVGVLFNEATLELLGTQSHEDTVVYPDAKPTFEVRLRPRRGGEVLRVLVVHLKAGGREQDVELRGQQLRALAGVLGRLREGDERLMLLGDLNSTSEADRRGVARLAAAAGLTWATAELRCTSYWQRPVDCQGTALDHVLLQSSHTIAAARGPCESEGCDSRSACPIFYSRVSDHCPVVVRGR